MGRYSDIEILIHSYDRMYKKEGLTDETLKAYVDAANYLMFTEKKRDDALLLCARVKAYAFRAIEEKTGGDFWALERYCQQNNVLYQIVERVYEIFLLESWDNLESFIFYMEKNREQKKRFYLKRKEALRPVLMDLEDLANRYIKFLGVSLPSRTGKSTLCIFFLTWIAMKRPNSHSAMCGHSGVLADGFYQELLTFMTSEEYTFGSIYRLWHPNGVILEDKSAEYRKINLDTPGRFSTITCRGIDGTWTGDVDVSVDGILYVDDLVRDREHSLSPTRMENTWQEYLNKVVDRKSGEEVEGSFEGSCELMVGTLWNVYDPLYRMELLHGEDPLYRFRKIPALNEDDETNFDYQYTTQYLREMRETLNPADWASKWMQAPYVREGLLYKEEELKTFVTCEDGRTVAILDPAVGGGDNLSMPIIRHAKGFYVIDWVYSDRTKDVTIPQIVSKIIFHNITELHYEKNGVGNMFGEKIKEQLLAKGYYRCKIMPFAAPEKMTKQEKIIGYSDWVKDNVYFIEKNSKGDYRRSEQYTRAIGDVCIYTTVGKNKTDDAVDSLAQTAMVFEEKKNGTIDIILNPFR